MPALWRMTEVRLTVESTEPHILEEHPNGRRSDCPQSSPNLACCGHAPKQQCPRHTACHFSALAHAPLPRVKRPGLAAVRTRPPWAKPRCGLTMLLERVVIDGLEACRTVKAPFALSTTSPAIVFGASSSEHWPAG